MNISAGDIYEAIRRSYCQPEWACFGNVGDRVGGYGASRRADAIAFNMWSSRGYEVRGFEIKVSRSDLNRELKNPAKADQIGSYCNTWFIVVPKGLCPKESIPATWGLIEFNQEAKKLNIVKQPIFNQNPDEPTSPFVASILRVACKEINDIRTEWIQRVNIRDEIDKAFVRGKKQAPNQFRHENERLREMVDGARSILAEVGIDIDKVEDGWIHHLTKYKGKSLADALRFGRVLLDRHNTSPRFISEELGRVESAIKELRNNINELFKADLKE